MNSVLRNLCHHITGDRFMKISIYMPLCFECVKNASEHEHESDGFLVKAKFSP
jgi:hypothetical protein